MNADAAMLMSKEQGRNTYTVFSYSTHQQETRSQSKLINDLYKAVEENNLFSTTSQNLIPILRFVG